MRSIPFLRYLLAIISSLLLCISSAHAADGTWDTDAAGNWTDITNWLGNTAYAEGTDNTATLGNFITGDRIINLNAPITIGNITASDTTHNYTISGANIITLDRTDATKPTINVTTSGRALTIGNVIAGSDGLLKSGAGTLVFNSSSNNIFTGGFDISGGVVQYDDTSNTNAWGNAANLITFTGNASLHNNNNAYTLARAITVNGGVTATLSGAFGESTNITGAVTGAGDVNIAGFSNGWAVTMSNTGNTLSGTVWVTSNAGQNTSLTVNSLADGADSTKRLKMGATTASADFTLTGSSVTPVVWTNRAVELAGTTGAISINNNSTNGTRTLTISQNLLFTTASNGNKTLTLGGSNPGANTFSGNIGNNGTSTTAITKTGGGTWALSGTNTYSGKSYNNSSNGTLIFQDVEQSLPSASALTFAITNNQNQTTRLLSDTSGTINLGNTVRTDGGGSSGTGNMSIFVGNNGAANGGNGVGGTTGSTIVLGTLDFRSSAEGGLVDQRMAARLAITGANGYKLQIGDVILQARGTTSATGAFLNPTTAPLLITGTIKQNNGRTAADNVGLQNLTLDGTSTNNIISGAIKNATDFDDLSNANALSTSLTKSNSGIWTLQGNNTYTGGTTITTGKVQFNGANSLPTTGTMAVGANGHFSLADGTARNQTVSALTLTSLASLSFDWTGSGTGDQLTSTAAIAPTAGSRFAVNLNRSGTPGGPLTLLTGGVGSTLSSSTFYLTNTTDFTATLSTPANNTLVVSGYTSQTPLTTFYWAGNKLAAGAVAGVDNAWALSDGTKTNWSSTTTAYTGTALTPGATADVIFSNSQAGKTQQSTVLGADVTVKSLTVDDGTAVTIAGSNGAALTLMSTSGTAGTVSTPGSAISVTSNANATTTISTRVILGADQTWHVANGKTLAVSGIVGGDYSLTKASAGTLTLSALPEYTGTTTISAGALTFGGGLSGGASIIGRTSGITLSQGATLNFNTSTTGINNVYTAGAPITLNGGAGTANIRVGGNDVRLYVSGNVTGQSGVAQTLSISQGLTPTGTTGGGDRQNILFSGVIANGGSGGTLGVSVNFAGSSGLAQNAFVNLSGQNTFTGDLTVTNSRGMNGGSGAVGAWLTIGGERYSLNPTIITNIGNGYLGGGNYAGNISISNGTGFTTLSYMSTANQTLSGQISGTGNVRMDGTGTLTLTNTNNYTGSTTVSAGTLAIASTGSITSNVTVQSGATFTNDGIVTGNVTVNTGGIRNGAGRQLGDLSVSGTHRPGNSPGVDIITGDYTISAGGKLQLELDNALGEVPGAGGMTNLEIQTYITSNNDNVYNSALPLQGGLNDPGTLSLTVGVLHDALEIGGNFIMAATGTIEVVNLPSVLKRGLFFDVLDVAGDKSQLMLALAVDEITMGGDVYLVGGGKITLPLIYANSGAESWSPFVYDLSLFQSQGIIIITPEPSRALLALLALVPFALRRRR